VSYGGPVHPDVVVFAEVQELPAGELGAVVGDDGVQDSKAMDDVGEDATTCLDLMLFRGRTSIHLENLSMATNRCVKPPGAFCKGPTRSRPHTANDHVMGIVCRA
jgi:hypothetical protein